MPISVRFQCPEIKNSEDTFAALVALHVELQKHSNENIEIDFSTISWFDAHLCSPLRVIVAHSVDNGNVHSLRGLREPIRNVLQRNGFLKSKLPDNNNTTMPVRHFGMDDHKDFAVYAKRYLMRRELPKMSDALQRKFHEGVDELFANSSSHSESKLGIFTAGQFYPTKKLLTMVISDCGIGVPGSLNKVGMRFRAHSEAIDWAMEGTNTTRRGDIPGGLGLKVLRDFVAVNQGSLHLISHRGYWCQNGQTTRKSDLQEPFPGTAVILEINTADKNEYDLHADIDARNIW